MHQQPQCPSTRTEASYHSMTIGRIPSVEGGIQPTIVDAKGDLIAATAADTVNRLAVGSNDQILVADSSTSTGLAWKSNATPFAAGKNALINGDFRINQRSFTSTTTDGAYGFDRWFINGSAGSCTYSAQTFTPGTAPVAGYEGVNFARLVTSGQNATSGYSILMQHIEDVRTFAGQTITVSFWAKANSGTPKIALETTQNFGSGGSATVDTYANQVTISTSWARYSITLTVPSVSGKTIGTSSSLRINFWTSAGTTYNSRTGSIGVQNNTIDFWGMQAESGNTATAFQTATGTLQGELAACQRYYWRSTPATNFGNYGLGMPGSATNAYVSLKLPSTMRVIPTSIDVPSTITTLKLTNIAATNWTISAIGLTDSTPDNLLLSITSSGMTANQSLILGNNNNAAGFIGASAEL
jgi:hypothetical protein